MSQPTLADLKKYCDENNITYGKDWGLKRVKALVDDHMSNKVDEGAAAPAAPAEPVAEPTEAPEVTAETAPAPAAPSEPVAEPTEPTEAAAETAPAADDEGDQAASVTVKNIGKTQHLIDGKIVKIGAEHTFTERQLADERLMAKIKHAIELKMLKEV